MPTTHNNARFVRPRLMMTLAQRTSSFNVRCAPSVVSCLSLTPASYFLQYSFARCLFPFSLFPAYTACLACPFLAHLLFIRFSTFFFYTCIFITLPHGLGCFLSIEDTR